MFLRTFVQFALTCVYFMAQYQMYKTESQNFISLKFSKTLVPVKSRVYKYIHFKRINRISITF